MEENNELPDIVEQAASGAIDRHRLGELLRPYIVSTEQSKAGGIINKDHVFAACHGAFSWIGWLVNNIERSCTPGESEHKNVGIEQVNQTLATILQLQAVMPEVIKLIGGKL